MNTAYAHSTTDASKADWEHLPDHLAAVARLAAEYASAFGASHWGELLGRWHDLGKYSDAFQRYIASGDPDAAEEGQSANRVDHSTFGARHAASVLRGVGGQLIAACIAGHHGGLADASPVTERGTLACRLDASIYKMEPADPPDALLTPLPLALPWKYAVADPAAFGFSLAFFGRMLFSCLIDADRTATEAFCDQRQARERARPTSSLAELRHAFDGFLSGVQARAEPTPVNAVRRKVLDASIAVAASPPGFFSLNVPTGGGKTFASLAFALHHAAANSALRRVVVAIPFTSIIEQTADQYRRALGPLAGAAIVEHHSNLNPDRDTLRNKLASENWSAPLVVTTNVQLLESLFASRTTPCRKLHRLANSVIVLDEAQTLPVDLLSPTLAALRELVAHYGCTVVLCTATQPALERRERDFEIGIENVRPIIADVNALHAALNRVTVERVVGKLDNAVLAERIASEPQVLCIVNTKAHAANLYDALAARTGKEASFHLSTLMCPQHRRDVLRRVRRILRRNVLATKKDLRARPCRVVSTQLIEAGVDVDFPCVFRAEAGFDSIAQAAGRCNREGKLTDAAGRPALGRVYVFEAESPPPPGLLRSAADAAGELAPDYADPLHPNAVRAYFNLHYGNQRRQKDWDARDVLAQFRFHPSDEDLAAIHYRKAADAYRIIRDEQTPAVVPYNAEARKLIEHLKTGEPLTYTHYKLVQQYSVGVRERMLHELADNTTAQRHVPLYSHDAGLWYLVSRDAYTPEKGVSTTATGIAPEDLFG